MSVHSRSNCNLKKCWFLRGGANQSTRKKTSLSKGENQQQTQPTYGIDAEFESGPHNGGRRVLSPLCHTYSDWLPVWGRWGYLARLVLQDKVLFWSLNSPDRTILGYKEVLFLTKLFRSRLLIHFL